MSSMLISVGMRIFLVNWSKSRLSPKYQGAMVSFSQYLGWQEVMILSRNSGMFI